MRWLAIVLVLSSAASVSADVPPDPRTLNAQCGIEEQCANRGRSCPAGRDVNHEEAERCVREAEAAGLRFRCQGGGNYVGFQIYCPANAPGGCSVEQQCPDGHACRGNERCETAGFFNRCVTKEPGTDEWISVYCPNGAALPDPGQNIDAAIGCGCSAGARRSPGWVALFAAAGIALLRRRRSAP